MRIKKLLELRRNLQQYYLQKAGLVNAVASDINVTDITPAIKTENSFVKRVREAVEENLTNSEFTVEQLCKLVFMSHSQLHRKLDALTGCSPIKFIRTIRLNKARELLMTPSNSISSVAFDCGYNDPAYFTRIFRQEFGMPPQEWRMQNGTEIS